MVRNVGKVVGAQKIESSAVWDTSRITTAY